MTHRELPPADWSRLAHTELGGCLEALPIGTRVAVVEDETGAIVGCWAVVPYTHLEGVWIAPKQLARGRIGAQLRDAVAGFAREAGVGVVLTAALTDDVVTLIEKLGGQELPGRHYAIPVGGL